MYSTRNLSIISSIILLIFLAISFFYGIISPPPLITYTTDENFIGESGIFLLFGNTPRALEWAALPSTFIAYFLFLLWCGISLIQHLSSVHGLTDILTLLDTNAFYYLNHREEFVIWERAIQIVLVGFIIYQTIQFIIHSKHTSLNRDTKIMLTLLCVSADVIWLSIPLIRPEALSGSLFLYITVCILFSEKITPKLATKLLLLFILTFTQRLIYLFLSPFVIIGLFIQLSNQKINWKVYLNYLLIVILAFFALMPFIISDTLVVLKSFLGGVFIKVNHDQMDTYFNMNYIHDFLSKPMNAFFSVCAMLGMWFLYKKHTSKLVVLVFIGNFLFYLFSSLKAAQLYPSHTFPLVMMGLILIAFGIGNTIKLNKNWKIALVGTLFFVNTCFSIYQNNTEIGQQQQNLADTISWVKSLKNNEKIALELDFDGLIPKNKACLLREYEANASDYYRMNKLHNLLKLPHSDSVNRFSLPIVAQSFAFEDEKLFDTQYQIALKYVNTDSSKRFDMDFFFESNNNMSHCLVREDALAKFKAGKYHYLISKHKLPYYSAVKSFEKGGGDRFFVYEFNRIN